MRDKDDDNEKQILILVSLKGTMILSKKKGKKGSGIISSIPFILSFSNDFVSILRPFAEKVWFREQWHDMQKYVIRVAGVSACTQRWWRVRVVGVRRCMRIWKSQWQPYQNGGPRGARGKREEKEREQARPEYRMLGIFISRCHSWKVASFP